jgi:predicted negative regulator of RcsB-dependent stress response
MDKKTLKKPDLLQAELQKGFRWSTQHSKIVLGVFGICFLAGAGIAGSSYLSEKNEEKIQAKYFAAEKAFLEKKQGFAAALAEEKRLAGNKDAKAKTKPIEANPAIGPKASGDYEKDFAAVATPMEQIISEAPHSKAAKMAALNLAQVQIQYKKFDSAKKSLSSVADNSKDLLGAMVQSELGTLLANENNCKEAISYWEKIASNKKAEFMHSPVQLKMGLCYEAMNENSKAEEIYSKVKEQEKDSSVGRSADKYLRLLQVKKI